MRSNSSLTGCARPRKGVFPARRHRAFARPPAAGVVSRRSWLRVLYGACSRHRNWRRPDVVPDASGTAVWTQDASAFYYVRLDQDHRPAGVFRHRLGTPLAEDVRVFAQPDPGLFISIGRLSSGRFANISAHDHETSEVWLVDLASPNAKPMLVARREAGIQYDVEHHPAFRGGPALIIRTN